MNLLRRLATKSGPAATAPRIALVTPMLPVAHDATRGRYIHETARSLSRLATVRVFFQTIRYPGWLPLAPRSYLYGDVPADYRLDGIDVEAFYYAAVPGLSRVLNGASAAFSLAPRVRRFTPDIVLGYWVYPDGAAALRVARSLGVPCVIGALGSDIHVRSRLNALLTRRTIAGCDALLTVSEAMRATAIDEFDARPERVHTIVNGFDASVFRPADRHASRAALGLGAAGRLIVYVGRFVESKGLSELIEAFQHLAADEPDVRLALIGDGVMRERLGALAGAAGLEGHVLFPGSMAPQQVAQWINASDLLVLPSWSEGYPNVVVEALACGRPVVATDVGGTREIVGPDSGILVRPRDATALAAGLHDALHRKWDEARIAERMRRSWDDVARETLAACSAVLDTRRRAHWRGGRATEPVAVPPLEESVQ